MTSRQNIFLFSLYLRMKPITIDYVFWPAPVRRYSFREHLKAAEAGGFTSLAVAPEAYRQAISSGLSANDMVTMTNDRGVALRAVQRPALAC
jgi:hypothetical protein